ncbi:hypothetical protein, partial [Snuella lapsa]|uniref:hypothetical protein n=1 Tax=Snuella lapsa TaxID=870481 RepID=UPI0031EB6662
IIAGSLKVALFDRNTWHGHAEIASVSKIPTIAKIFPLPNIFILRDEVISNSPISFRIPVIL